MGKRIFKNDVGDVVVGFRPDFASAADVQPAAIPGAPATAHRLLPRFRTQLFPCFRKKGSRRDS
jgi:hypothetical protein